MGQTSFSERILLKVASSRLLDSLALKALMKANELLGLALGVRLAALRDSGEPLREVFSEGEQHALLARCWNEACELLGERWDKIPDLRRPQYTPEQRYRILRLKHLLALGNAHLARVFRVCPETLARWERQANAVPTESARPLVRPNPPVRRFADVVRQLVHTMRLAGFGGYETIAQTLARAGYKLSKCTVARILRENPPLESPVQDALRAEARVTANRPNHTFLVDLTDVPGLIGIFRFKLAVVLDVFSRFPLAAAVFRQEPSALELLALVRCAMARFGPPRYLVTDQGPQFTSEPFRQSLSQLGIQHRFGAIGKVGSIALLERFWRTLKHLLRARAFPPLVTRELEARLELVLYFYAFLRPHRGLDGATPAELHFGLEPLHFRALPPPRGRPGQGPSHPLCRVEYLDPDRRLPFLVKAA